MKDTQHSSTALVIAKSTLLTAQDPKLGQLVPAGAAAACEWFVRDYARDHGLLQQAWYRTVLSLLEAWILPGVQLHYALRKRLLERQVERAIHAGTEQVVVVAGGFDTLAYRLHQRFENVRFFELDHPATQESKRKSLLAHGAMRRNLVLHPVDLTCTALSHALSQAGIDRERPTIVLAEGVLMYLSRDQVGSFFAALGAYFTNQVVLALTFMAPDAKGRRRFHNGSWLLTAWLSLVGEPFLSAFDHETLLTLLGRYQFVQGELWDDQRLRREVLPAELQGRPLAVGEHLCVCLRAAQIAPASLGR